MVIVVALGGNALLKRGEPMEASVQRSNIQEAVSVLAELAREHTLVVTHGNGPQVGLLALLSAAYDKVNPYPLDVLGAESEGMIGYMIEQELRNALPDRDVATLLTQTVVDPKDPAFQSPTKFIGPVYSEVVAKKLATARNWTVKPDGGYFRRVVPSPEPKQILEVSTIKLLVNAGIIVISTGGGGVPVIVSDQGCIHGVEAVIDKDRATALLAKEIGADWLMMLTDVPAVYKDWGKPSQRAIKQANPEQLLSMEFASGSMGPKITAACEFAATGTNKAGIGRLTDAVAILNGEAGTIIESNAHPIRWYPQTHKDK